MKGNLTINIDKEITEQKLIEDCLMKKHSGYDYRLTLVFYALEKRWDVEKLIYYINLIEEEEWKIIIVRSLK